MSDVLDSDLHKRVERYELAVEELRAAHQAVRDVLLVDVLFERWKQLGLDLGFGAESLPDGRFRVQGHRDLVVASAQDKHSEPWAG